MRAERSPALRTIRELEVAVRALDASETGPA
jgi:hypothetical protein